MFSRKEVGPTRFTGSIAIIGIAIGTMAMVLSISVLNGFESRIIEKIIGFEGDKFRKHCLLKGLDDIELTMKKIEKINSFEKIHNTKSPWL